VLLDAPNQSYISSQYAYRAFCKLFNVVDLGSRSTYEIPVSFQTWISRDPGRSAPRQGTPTPHCYLTFPRHTNTSQPRRAYAEMASSGVC